MPLILASNSASGGYNVANSLRFNGPSSDYLNRNSNNNTDPTKVTWSFWTKRSSLTDTRRISMAMTSGFAKYHYIRFEDGILNIYNSAGTAYTLTQQFRDVGAWYHIVVSIDTTLATSTDRVKVYVNGSQVTAFTSSTAPTQNAGIFIGETSNAPFVIGALYGVGYGITTGSPTEFYSGYISEFYLIEGQQLTPSSFGQTDPSVPSSGIWIPKAYSGSYGTNGFYLKFANSAALGTDSSGNGNNFTVNNLTSVDQSTDTPTNNFATGNPLFIFTTPSPTYSNGNLTIVGASGYNVYTNGTFMVSKGKWYFETTSTDKDVSIGVKVPNKYSAFNNSGDGYYGFYNYNGDKITNGVFSASQSAGASNDILQLALDMDNNKLWIGRNGTYFASGNPSAGTGEFLSSLPTELVPSLQNYNNTTDINFGSPPFTIVSGNADANGFGNFEYAVPSGYYALCTKNLADYG